MHHLTVSSAPTISHRMLVLLHNLDWCSNVGEYDNPFVAHPVAERADLVDDVIQLKRMLPRLPLQDQRLVVLIGLYHVSEEEAGRQLGLSQPAVNKRLHRIADWLVAA